MSKASKLYSGFIGVNYTTYYLNSAFQLGVIGEARPPDRLPLDAPLRHFHKGHTSSDLRVAVGVAKFFRSSSCSSAILKTSTSFKESAAEQPWQRLVKRNAKTVMRGEAYLETGAFGPNWPKPLAALWTKAEQIRNEAAATAAVQSSTASTDDGIRSCSGKMANVPSSDPAWPFAKKASTPFSLQAH